ncbi:MAG: thiamine biosynthesis protein ApbE [Gammaproteobacteria bacterium]|nr:MAG: thiamine biosynthesis protein ApbE [Gammaproteobacteria bacterium]
MVVVTAKSDVVIKALLLVCLICLPTTSNAQWWHEQHHIMGTLIDVEVWHEKESFARQAIEAVVEEMHRIDRLLSPYKANSVVSRMNQYASAKKLTLDPETFFILSQAEKISVMTGGAFDITFASIGFLYDFRKKVRPNEQQTKQYLHAIDFRRVKLNEKDQSVEFLHPKIKIDLGGIAKGYACDRAITILKQYGIEHGVVSAGGDSRLLGDRHGRPWIIGIKNPRGEQPIISIPIQDVAISTSGDYERFFKRDGVRYHHIIDPSNGDSARELRSVTIIADQGVVSDGLSTGVFVLGLKAGLELINRLDGVSAIVIDAQGQLHYSSDLEGL